MPLWYDDLVELNRHQLLDEDAQARAVTISNERAVANGIIKIPDVALHAGEMVTLAPYQTGFRSQDGRDSCYSFAACAALEAAYRRTEGVIIDLSEQYAYHVNMAFELFPDYLTDGRAWENNTSMDGYLGGSDIVDKLARAAVPLETDAPYLSGTAMQKLSAATPAWTRSTQEGRDAVEFAPGHIPLAARTRAVYRARTVHALPADPTTEMIKKVVRYGHEVVVDIPKHCFLIIGYDDGVNAWIVKNSWGENRFISYGYDKKIEGGRWIEDVEPVGPPQMRAFWLGRWEIDHDGWVGELVIRRFTDYHREDTEATKLGTYYRNGKGYDVNGTISLDGRTMDFWIADTTDRVAIGSQRGQHVTAYMFAGGDRAAGTTTWEGTSYGVRLTRQPAAHTRIDHFDRDRWLDSWAMNHDGWVGTLRVAQLDPVLGTWEGPDRHQLQVDGAVDPQHPHHLTITVPFDAEHPQPFDVYHHTWEDGAFSGSTWWEGHRYGAMAGRFVEPSYPPFAPPGVDITAAFVYGVDRGGLLKWFRHDGAGGGGGPQTWRGPRTVGRGWGDLIEVFGGGGDVIYAIGADGSLFWFRHLGFNTGLTVDEPGGWSERRVVGRGWADGEKVFAGGDGVIYLITRDGTLRWYRHLAVATGEGLETPGAWADAHDVGVGWQGLEHVFSTGDGVIYTIATDGVLRWYRHVGFASGHGLETPGAGVGPLDVGTGWGGLRSVVARADGIIYAIRADGTLRWFRHRGYAQGWGLDHPGAWEGGRDVGTGWSVFPRVLTLLPRAAAPVH